MTDIHATLRELTTQVRTLEDREVATREILGKALVVGNAIADALNFDGAACKRWQKFGAYVLNAGIHFSSDDCFITGLCALETRDKKFTAFIIFGGDYAVRHVPTDTNWTCPDMASARRSILALKDIAS